jgi:diguanylate cyclase (GGDEF)-like protein
MANQKESGQFIPKLQKDLLAIERAIHRAFVAVCALNGLILAFLIFALLRWGTVSKFMLLGYIALFLWAIVMAVVFFYLIRFTRYLEENYSRKTFVDELTDTFNLRYVDQRMTEEEQRIKRNGGQAAVLFVDLDNFKEVNDRYGHTTGNMVLREIAQALKDEIRASDVLGRLGGDEFVVLMPGTDKAQAYKVAERLSNKVSEYEIRLENQETIDFVGASVGLAIYPDNGDTMVATLAAADHALYKAKNEGGGCVKISEQRFKTRDGVVNTFPTSLDYWEGDGTETTTDEGHV